MGLMQDSEFLCKWQEIIIFFWGGQTVRTVGYNCENCKTEMRSAR